LILEWLGEYHDNKSPERHANLDGANVQHLGLRNCAALP
jgi:hypothetical protein